MSPGAGSDTGREIIGIADWYHTLEFPGGQVTPGFVDWRRHADRILPADMSCLRALDVGTYDGFWAFEMERRGASVVAIDLDHLDAADWPPVHRDRLQTEVTERGTQL